MNTRLEQDAADSLEAHERQQRWRAQTKADYARSQGAVMTGTWSPPALTPQQQQQHDQYVIDNNLPF